MKYLIIFMILLSARLASSQTITMSPKIGYGFFSLNLISQIDKYFLIGGGGLSETNHIGIDTKFFFKNDKFYVNPSFTYGDEAQGYSIENSDPQTYEHFDENGNTIYYFREFNSLSFRIPNRVFKYSLSFGGVLLHCKSKFSLRALTGFTLDYRTEKNIEDRNRYYRERQQPPEGEPRVDEITLFNSIIDAERPWLLNGHIGLGLDVGKFWLDVTYHKSLTDLNRDIEYYNQFYDYRLQTQQLLFTIGWNILLKKGESNLRNPKN